MKLLVYPVLVALVTLSNEAFGCSRISTSGSCPGNQRKGTQGNAQPDKQIKSVSQPDKPLSNNRQHDQPAKPTDCMEEALKKQAEFVESMDLSAYEKLSKDKDWLISVGCLKETSEPEKKVGSYAAAMFDVMHDGKSIGFQVKLPSQKGSSSQQAAASGQASSSGAAQGNTPNPAAPAAATSASTSAAAASTPAPAPAAAPAAAAATAPSTNNQPASP